MSKERDEFIKARPFDLFWAMSGMASAGVSLEQLKSMMRGMVEESMGPREFVETMKRRQNTGCALAAEMACSLVDQVRDCGGDLATAEALVKTFWEAREKWAGR